MYYDPKPADSNAFRGCVYGLLFTAALVILMVLLVLGVQALTGALEGFAEWLAVALP